MISCYPFWTAAAPAVRRATHHIGRRISRHGIRHAAMATVRIVCIATPAWLAAPAPAAAPPVPDTVAIMPPPMLPWPEADGAPWGQGGGYGPGIAWAPSDAPPQLGQGGDQPTVLTFVDRSSQPPPVVFDKAPPPQQPVPEPSSAAVIGVGMLVLGWRRRRVR